MNSGLDDAIDIILRREFGDVFHVAGGDHRLGARATDRAAMHQGLVELGRQGNALFHARGGGRKFFECGRARLARHVFLGRALEVQCADPIGARFQKIRQFVDLCGVGITTRLSQ